jgi:hypothetical protein
LATHGEPAQRGKKSSLRRVETDYPLDEIGPVRETPFVTFADDLARRQYDRSSTQTSENCEIEHRVRLAAPHLLGEYDGTVRAVADSLNLIEEAASSEATAKSEYKAKSPDGRFRLFLERSAIGQFTSSRFPWRR